MGRLGSAVWDMPSILHTPHVEGEVSARPPPGLLELGRKHAIIRFGRRNDFSIMLSSCLFLTSKAKPANKHLILSSSTEYALLISYSADLMVPPRDDSSCVSLAARGFVFVLLLHVTSFLLLALSACRTFSRHRADAGSPDRYKLSSHTLLPPLGCFCRVSLGAFVWPLDCRLTNLKLRLSAVKGPSES